MENSDPVQLPRDGRTITNLPVTVPNEDTNDENLG